MAEARLNGRDEDGFTEAMRWHMKQSLLLHDYDEREPDRFDRRTDNRRLKRLKLRQHRVVSRREPEGEA